MTDSTSAGSSKTMDFVQALNVAEGVFEQYRQDQPKWWKRMDGTPILNDVAVRMAEAFRDEIKRLQQVGVRLAAEKFELKGQLNEARGGHETLPGHDLRVMCPAEVDVKAIDKALGPGWVHRLATGLQSSRAPRQRPERESDALLAAAMLTGEMGSDTPKANALEAIPATEDDISHWWRCPNCRARNDPATYPISCPCCATVRPTENGSV